MDKCAFEVLVGSSKTGNDIWYMDSEESGGEEVGFGENEDVEMDAWSIKAGHVRNERIRGTMVSHKM